jgi:hypothetical protein
MRNPLRGGSGAPDRRLRQVNPPENGALPRASLHKPPSGQWSEVGQPALRRRCAPEWGIDLTVGQGHHHESAGHPRPLTPAPDRAPGARQALGGLTPARRVRGSEAERRRPGPSSAQQVSNSDPAAPDMAMRPQFVCVPAPPDGAHPEGGCDTNPHDNELSNRRIAGHRRPRASHRRTRRRPPHQNTPHRQHHPHNHLARRYDPRDTMAEAAITTCNPKPSLPRRPPAPRPDREELNLRYALSVTDSTKSERTQKGIFSSASRNPPFEGRPSIALDGRDNEGALRRDSDRWQLKIVRQILHLDSSYRPVDRNIVPDPPSWPGGERPHEPSKVAAKWQPTPQEPTQNHRSRPAANPHKHTRSPAKPDPTTPSKRVVVPAVAGSSPVAHP